MVKILWLTSKSNFITASTFPDHRSRRKPRITAKRRHVVWIMHLLAHACWSFEISFEYVYVTMASPRLHRLLVASRLIIGVSWSAHTNAFNGYITHLSPFKRALYNDRLQEEDDGSRGLMAFLIEAIWISSKAIVYRVDTRCVTC